MKYDVKFSCGHEGVIELYGKQAERERKIYSAERYGCCPECEARKRAEENKKNSELAKAIELPELKGSEKQIAWAETIRMKFVEANKYLFDTVKNLYTEKGKDEVLNKIKNPKNYEQEAIANKAMYLLEVLENQSSQYFIENRMFLK